MENGVWAKRITVVLHYVPEDEDFEGGFEAETMTGIPGNVTTTYSTNPRRVCTCSM